MRKVIFTLTNLFFVVLLTAQTPAQFKYQAVLRDAGGNLIADQSVAVDVDLLKGSVAGASVFSEQHNVTTTERGLINLNIGSVNDMSSIDFSNDAYFIKITVDGTVMGTSQLLAVPYAVVSKTTESVDYADVNNLPPDLDTDAADDFSGSFNDLTDVPAGLDTDAADDFDGDYNSLTNKPTNVSTFTNDAGYLTAEVDGSTTNEIELPAQAGNSGKFLTTDGNSPSWVDAPSSSSNLTVSDFAQRTVTSNVTLTASDYFVIVNAAVTVTMPSSPADGQTYVILDGNQLGTYELNGNFWLNGNSSLITSFTTIKSDSNGTNGLNKKIIRFIYSSAAGIWLVEW